MKIIALIILSTSLWAQNALQDNDQGVEQIEFRRQDFQIDETYKSGNNLIYDCARKHYACVNNDGWDLCTSNREKDKEHKEKEYSCSPLKKFNDKTKCVLKNYQVMEKNAWKRFCFPK